MFSLISSQNVVSNCYSLLIFMQVWAVLKPGFLAFLDDPFDTQLLDIIVFDVIPASAGNGASQQNLANQMKERNPLRYAFRVRYFFLYFVKAQRF